MASWLMAVSMPNATAQTPPPPRTVDKGDFSNVDNAKQVVVRTAAEWRSLWRQHAGDRPMPSVDFGKEMVVGVFMGSRPTAGFDIAIASTIEANGILHVRYREQTPARGLILAQVLTFPFHLVAIPKTAAEVKFEKES
ncbi:MAG TPA: protease complex subunit PrcB family protein [Vicinamibacterales bacterium]|nr:protease complex subunit PrcB family protein [Vicinamibacterales bacterium]